MVHFTANLPEPCSTVTFQGVPWYVMRIRLEGDETGIIAEARILPISDQGDDLSTPDNPPLWVDVELIDGFGN